ncbi:hypothetical protein KP509_38G024200 [Ceratopteris richardii]|uniref:Pentatricopeptide repeat-containing protein n=1 Tax=Ceratopteris richardii TaxID=49495 RepID=A0A8T2Q391_CERRI|nr:hypothetical protein KP509_38G024200 [Ceratopteris richardii]
MAVKLPSETALFISRQRSISTGLGDISNPGLLLNVPGEETSLDQLIPSPPSIGAVIDGNPLAYGRLLHAHLLKTTVDLHYAETHLVQMYCKCSCLEDACAVFRSFHIHLVVPAWNSIIKLQVKKGKSNCALQFYDQMLTEGFIPTSFTYTPLISACTSQFSLSEGCRLHARVNATELRADVVVGTALVVMYGKFGSLDRMRFMFDTMPFRDALCWTALISAYVHHGKSKIALEAFFLMERENVSPIKVTFITILSACSSKEFLSAGKELHAYIKRSGVESDINIANALLSMYGRCGSVESARLVFDSMQEWNLISWNAIITVYAQNEKGAEALCIAYHMQQSILPDDITLVSMLDACASLGALSDGMRIHACISTSRLEGNPTLGNAIINMYGKCNKPEKAVEVFDAMKEHDAVTWNTLISVFTNQENGGQRALFIGKRIHALIANNSIAQDVVLGTAILNMYGKSHMLSFACQIFNLMPVKNVVCWTAMISAYAQNEKIKEAVSLFHSIEMKQDVVLWNSMLAAFSQNQLANSSLILFEQMLQEGIAPNRATFVSSLDACTSEVILKDGKHFHSRIRGASFEQDTIVENSLIAMYGRCGSLDVACELFGQLQKRNLFAWSSMIAAYAQRGLGKEALGVFTQMQQEGIVPDEITFVNVLSACSHAGLVHEGCEQFTSMQDDYGITPTIDHYNCMIDLLGRSGQLDEIERLIINMKVPPTAISWLTFLSACRNNKDVRRGVWAAESLFKVDPNDATPYILLSSLYAAVGRLNDATDVILRMNCKGLRCETIDPGDVHPTLYPLLGLKQIHGDVFLC